MLILLSGSGVNSEPGETREPEGGETEETAESTCEKGIGNMSVVGAAGRLGLPGISSWGYQLQGRNGQAISIVDVMGYEFYLMVLDNSADGTEDKEFSRADIEGVKATGKIVLAYMSIGEAEDYRFYWDWMPKSLIIEENPDWPGNYKVKYWTRTWKNILFSRTSGPRKSYLDRIIDQGFDGVYLDIVDAYEFAGPHEIGGTDRRRTAAADMIRLVGEIADHARITRGRPDFCIVPQNAVCIWDQENFPDDPDPEGKSRQMRQRYLADIDAIGVEDVFFFGPRNENNPYRPDQWVINHLTSYQEVGKLILSVEYVTWKKKVKKYYQAASQNGYVPLATRRALNGVFFRP